jgi:hypothetical protein
MHFMQGFQNALAYFTTVVSYVYKMLIKLTQLSNVKRHLISAIYKCLLEFLSLAGLFSLV